MNLQKIYYQEGLKNIKLTLLYCNETAIRHFTNHQEGQKAVQKSRVTNYVKASLAITSIIESSLDGNARKEIAIKMFEKVTESLNLNVYKSIEVIGTMKTSSDRTDFCLTQKEENNPRCEKIKTILGEF